MLYTHNFNIVHYAGIRYTHDEFGGRALYPGYDPVDAKTGSNRQGWDCHGHGTHVAGLAGGSTYGVADDATLYSLRVLDCDGRGSTSGVIDGINYAATEISSTGRPGIVSMSLGGSYSQSVNDAVEAAVENGAHVVVAAGNEDTDACTRSPASAPSAITVGATDFINIRASFSNYGTCVDIFAPGEDINSASYSCDSCTTRKSGTSMACPLTSGVAATLLQASPLLTPEQLSQQLIDASSEDKVYDVGSGSPNKFLFARSGSG